MEIEGRGAIWPRPRGKYRAEVRFEPQPETALAQSLLPDVPLAPAKAPKCTPGLCVCSSSHRECRSLRLSMEASQGGPHSGLAESSCVSPSRSCAFLSLPCKLNLAPGDVFSPWVLSPFCSHAPSRVWHAALSAGAEE